MLGFLISVEFAAARPQFLTQYQNDPLRRADQDGCNVCHVDPKGGGPRNEFGAAFQTAGRVITPLFRAGFPDKFGFVSTRLADGSVFSFSDPKGQIVVVERQEQRVSVDIAALTAKKEEDKLPPPENRMGFFVTSKGMGKGGHLSGLGGADRHCQALAQAAGAGDRTWRAYLSTSFQDKPAVNAGDRIGTGPWFNAKGILVARGVADLHKDNRLSKEMALTEKGEVVDTARHAILTGTLPDGTAAVGENCNNWTSPEQGTARVGYHDRQGSGADARSWNASSVTSSCTQQAFQASGGDGLFYCFALK